MPHLLCHIRLPWCESDVELHLQQNACRETLLEALSAHMGETEVFVFANDKMVLPGQCLDLCTEVLILPLLSGG